MPELAASETLQATLQPIRLLQGEHEELESLVHDAFSAVEQLHAELNEWQSELAVREEQVRHTKQTLEQDTNHAAVGSEDLLRLQKSVQVAKEELKQLEEESTEQIQALEDLERQHSVLQAELRVERKRSQELVRLLDAERIRAAEEYQRFGGELKYLRLLLEKHCGILEGSPISSLTALEMEELERPDLDDARAMERSAELRRRAKERRAAHKHSEDE